MSNKFHNFLVKYQELSTICLRSFATSWSSIKSQVLDLKTLPIFSPLKMSVKFQRLSFEVQEFIHIKALFLTQENELFEWSLSCCGGGITLINI